MPTRTRIVLEPAAQALVEATAQPPCLYAMESKDARKVLDDLHAQAVDKLPGDEEWISVSAEATPGLPS